MPKSHQQAPQPFTTTSRTEILTNWLTPVLLLLEIIGHTLAILNNWP
ncbi:hypothetical protein ACWENO_19885 [Streptomyces sp. NPDC004436]